MSYYPEYNIEEMFTPEQIKEIRKENTTMRNYVERIVVYWEQEGYKHSEEFNDSDKAFNFMENLKAQGYKTTYADLSNMK